MCLADKANWGRHLGKLQRFKPAFKAHSTARNRVRQEAFLIEQATTEGQVC